MRIPIESKTYPYLIRQSEQAPGTGNILFWLSDGCIMSARAAGKFEKTADIFYICDEHTHIQYIQA